MINTMHYQNHQNYIWKPGMATPFLCTHLIFLSPWKGDIGLPFVSPLFCLVALNTLHEVVWQLMPPFDTNSPFCMDQQINYIYFPKQK